MLFGREIADEQPIKSCQFLALITRVQVKVALENVLSKLGACPIQQFSVDLPDQPPLIERTIYDPNETVQIEPARNVVLANLRGNKSRFVGHHFRVFLQNGLITLRVVEIRCETLR